MLTNATINSYQTQNIIIGNKEEALLGVRRIIDYIKLLQCPISLKMMEIPAQIIKCKHLFDEEYLKCWYEKNSGCPICKDLSSDREYTVNRLFQERIAGIKKETKEKGIILAGLEKEVAIASFFLENHKTDQQNNPKDLQHQQKESFVAIDYNSFNAFTKQNINNVMYINKKIELKIQFIKKNYNFISWEENLQAVPAQIVSKLYKREEAKNKALLVYNSLHFENSGAIATVEDTINFNQYRIVINLERFHESSIIYQNLIMNFLNDTCLPTDDIWNTIPNKSRYSPSKWYNQLGVIKLITPSRLYESLLVENAVKFHNFMMNAVANLDTLHGTSNFKDNFKFSDNSQGCHYIFLTDFLYGDLLKIAIAHDEQKNLNHKIQLFISKNPIALKMVQNSVAILENKNFHQKKNELVSNNYCPLSVVDKIEIRSNQITLENKGKFIRNFYNFVSWENDLRLEDPNPQLVSNLYDQETAILKGSQICDSLHFENKDAINTVKSRNSDQYRILIKLENFNEPALVTKKITTFLEENLNLTNDMWDKIENKKHCFFNKQVNFPKPQWEMDETNGFICLSGPSISYTNFGDIFNKHILSNVEKLDTFLGQKFFKYNLNVEDHKRECVYFFKIDFVYKLLQMAIVHDEKKQHIPVGPTHSNY
jgi:hypothetical protein